MSKSGNEFDEFEALLAESARVAADFDAADSDDYAESIQPDLVERNACLLYTSPSPRDVEESRMPSSA